MKIAIIAFSKRGYELGGEITKNLGEKYVTKLYGKSKYIENSIEESLNEWTKKQFHEQDAIIFISSTGIAIRAIAPFVHAKDSDPAIIVIDERAGHVIPLLSGHLGGAIELAKEISKVTGATPVITTATDVGERLAPDVFAKKNGLIIDSLKAAKNIAAAIVAGDKTYVFVDESLTINGEIPREVSVKTMAEIDGDPKKPSMIITPHDDFDVDENKLWLLPRTIHLGVGCRRGTPYEEIDAAINKVLEEEHVDIRAIKKMVSIDLKKDEEGLLKFSKSNDLKTEFFSADELREAPGDFVESEFVKGITGVGNVCERSAMLSAARDAKETVLIRKKTAIGRVTVALVMEKGGVSFE